MFHHFRLLLAWIALVAILPYTPAQAVPQTLAASSHQANNISSTASPFVPLPKSCGGGLPAGANVPVCCMFGYVFIDGQAVAGAKVTITFDASSSS